MITHKLKMNLQEGEVVQRLEMPLGDANARKMEMLLYSGATAWEIPTGIAVLIRYLKPDGTKGAYDKLPNGAAAWTTAGNALTIAVAPQVLTVAGKVALYAEIYLEEKVLHTFAVELWVKSPYDSRFAGKCTDSQDYYYATNVLRGPVMAQNGQVLSVEEVDAYGRVKKVQAQDPQTIVGDAGKAVLYVPQVLTEAQKAQARENINALAVPTRSVVTQELFAQVTLSDFFKEDTWKICTYGTRQRWLNSADDFDFDLEIRVGQKNLVISKAECEITDMGTAGNHAWMVTHPAFSGWVLHIGNGQHPLNLMANNMLSFAFGGYEPSVFRLTFYRRCFQQTDAVVVTSVNGAEPDKNGNVTVSAVAQNAVLYTEQSLTAAQKDRARKNIDAAASVSVQAIEVRLLDGSLTMADKKNNDDQLLYAEAGKLRMKNTTAQNKTVTFLTDEDKTGLIADVIAALPIYSGEVEEV